LPFGQVRENPELWGRWVESAIGAHLLNYARIGPLKLLYWRQGNHEIDFVIEYRNEFIGLEIKSSRSRALSGMERFRRLFGPKKVLLVGNSGIPWQEFLQIDPLDLF
jgi:predicted AAA+ superfamily ATPase